MLAALIVGAMLLDASYIAAQAPSAPPATLTLAGDVRSPLVLKAGDIRAMPRTRVETKNEEGRSIAYEGVLISEILTRAGVPLGRDLRGNALATYVSFIASDGYQVVFSLAELDP